MFTSWVKAFRLFSVIFLLGFLILGSGPVSAGDDLPELLGAGQTLRAARVDALALRARTASLNLDLLRAARAQLDMDQVPAPIALTLFEDTRLVARFHHLDRSENGFTLSGAIDGSQFAEIYISVVGDAFFASLNTHKGVFIIRSSGGQSAEVIQMDSSRLPEEAEPVAVPASDGSEEQQSVPVPLVGATTTDDGSRIDVFVGYTDDARVAAGGTSYIQAMINTGIAETNGGYSYSLVNQRVNLVGTAEYAYDETSFDWSTTLSRWTGTVDGYMDTVHATRDTLKADEVVLIVNNTAYCGIGYQMSSTDIGTAFATYAFALVSRTCLTGYYSLAHEMGHNMGAQHDRYTGGTGAYTYAHGYWIETTPDYYPYRTIMAYDVPYTYGYDSTRVNRWSNPYVLYSGYPTGKPTTDPESAYNALVLNNTAWAVARFRDGAVPPAPTGLTVTGLLSTLAQVTWLDVAGEWLYRVERSVYGSGVWSEVGQTGANVLEYFNTNSHSTTDYSYRVLSDNGNGRTVSASVVLPRPPINLTPVALSTTSLRLNWTDQSAAETSFRIERSPTSTSSYTEIASTTTNDVSHDLTSIATTSEYKYRVRSRNGSGNSFYSNSVNGLPARPASTSVSQISMSRLRISWADSSLIESGYRLEHSKYGTEPWTLVANLPANTTTYDDVDLPCSTLYAYRVRAYTGLGSSEWSTNPGVATAACGIPPSPAPLIAHSLADNVYLSWTNVDGEDLYYVFRCNSLTCTSPVLITTVGRNVSSYDVTGLTPSTGYYFGVRAYNAYGFSALPMPTLFVNTSASEHYFFLPVINK